MGFVGEELTPLMKSKTGRHTRVWVERIDAKLVSRNTGHMAMQTFSTLGNRLCATQILPVTYNKKNEILVMLISISLF